MMNESITYSKDIPVRWRTDVCVVGGGIAGVCAACAAAESGVSVVLVERFAVTGGMMTIGGVNNFCGETAGQGRIFDEMLTELEQFGAIHPYKPYGERGSSRPFNHETLTVILQEMMLKRGVKLLLHTRFVDVIGNSDNGIESILLRGQSGPEALWAKQFIDCTGEGELALLAGCETMKGRESDGLQLPMSLMYFVREVADEYCRCEVPEGWQEPITKGEDLPMTSIWPNGPQSKAVKIKVIGHDSTDTESMANAEMASRRKMMQVLDFHQRVQGKNWLLDHVSPIIGIREGRRVVGDYILTELDARAGRAFDDGVAVGTFYIDAHEPTTDKRVAQIVNFEDRVVPPYQIPLRSLTARDSANLWVAGRNLSADLKAMASARVATSGAMMGQAAGIAAALAAKSGCLSHDIDAAEVRKTVIDRGANLDLSGRPTSLA